MLLLCLKKKKQNLVQDYGIQINDGGSDQGDNNGEKWLDYRYMLNMMEQAKSV